MQIYYIRNELFKKYEDIVGKAIESEARDSCKRAALEEKKHSYKKCQTTV